MARQPIAETRQYNRGFRAGLERLPWISNAFVMAERKPCPACAAAAREYPIGDLPDLPVPGCEKSKGCTCWFVALLPAGCSR